MSWKSLAQRKFAQGAYVPPINQINLTPERKFDQPVNTNKDATNIVLSNMSAKSLLDVVSFKGQYLGNLQPTVVLNRLNTETIKKPTSKKSSVLNSKSQIITRSKTKEITKKQIKLKIRVSKTRPMLQKRLCISCNNVDQKNESDDFNNVEDNTPLMYLAKSTHQEGENEETAMEIENNQTNLNPIVASRKTPEPATEELKTSLEGIEAHANTAHTSGYYGVQEIQKWMAESITQSPAQEVLADYQETVTQENLVQIPSEVANREDCPSAKYVNIGGITRPENSSDFDKRCSKCKKCGCVDKLDTRSGVFEMDSNVDDTEERCVVPETPGPPSKPTDNTAEKSNLYLDMSFELTQVIEITRMDESGMMRAKFVPRYEANSTNECSYIEHDNLLDQLLTILKDCNYRQLQGSSLSPNNMELLVLDSPQSMNTDRSLGSSLFQLLLEQEARDIGDLNKMAPMASNCSQWQDSTPQLKENKNNEVHSTHSNANSQAVILDSPRRSSMSKLLSLQKECGIKELIRAGPKASKYRQWQRPVQQHDNMNNEIQSSLPSNMEAPVVDYPQSANTDCSQESPVCKIVLVKGEDSFPQLSNSTNNTVQSSLPLSNIEVSGEKPPQSININNDNSQDSYNINLVYAEEERNNKELEIISPKVSNWVQWHALKPNDIELVEKISQSVTSSQVSCIFKSILEEDNRDLTTVGPDANISKYVDERGSIQQIANRTNEFQSALTPYDIDVMVVKPAPPSAPTKNIEEMVIDPPQSLHPSNNMEQVMVTDTLQSMNIDHNSFQASPSFSFVSAEDESDNRDPNRISPNAHTLSSGSVHEIGETDVLIHYVETEVGTIKCNLSHPSLSTTERNDNTDLPSGAGMETRSRARKKKTEEPCNLVSNLVDAPVFYPTAAEFQNPIEYFEKIIPEAGKFGLCKVVAPPDFKLPCAMNINMRFKVMNQYITRLFSRWSPAAREMCAIKAQVASQKVKLVRGAPLLDGIEVNLPKFYSLIKRHGGVMEAMTSKLWGPIAEQMGLPKSGKHFKKMHKLFLKYILPYETLSPNEKQEILRKVDKHWSKKNRKIFKRSVNPLHKKKKLLGDSESSGEDSEEEKPIAEALSEAEDCIVSGRTMSLSIFQKIALNTMNMFFPNSMDVLPMTKQVETMYWNLVTKGTDHVCVNTASIDTGDEGYVFTKEKTDNYSNHPWNLKVLSQNPGNVLHFLGQVLGVTVPTLHLGMVFSTSCWHCDPHGLPWMEYMHKGPGKIWYGIPSEQTSAFRQAINKFCPTVCQGKPIWLPSDVAMVPPELLLKHNVSLSRVVQHPGEYIIVFPKAYSCSISTGFTVSESVYFATDSWLKDVHHLLRKLKFCCEPTMFSLERLLVSVAKDPNAPVNQLSKVCKSLIPLIEEELSYRNHLMEMVPNLAVVHTSCSRKHDGGGWNAQEQDECEICRSTLFFAKVTGIVGNRNSVCLEHAVQILTKSNNAQKATLVVYYSNEELETMSITLEKRILTSI